jgi:hypothetical protein
MGALATRALKAALVLGFAALGVGLLIAAVRAGPGL